jgi:hypothetical protein
MKNDFAKKDTWQFLEVFTVNAVRTTNLSLLCNLALESLSLLQTIKYLRIHLPFDVTLCSGVSSSGCFKGTWCLRFQQSILCGQLDCEVDGTMNLPHIRNYSPINTAS